MRIWPALALLSYLLLIGALGGFSISSDKTQQYVVFSVIFLILNYLGERSRRFFKAILPFVLVALIYDSQTYWRHLIPSKIHVSEPYEFELQWFGVLVDGARVIPSQALDGLIHPALDLLTGAIYFIYMIAVLAMAAAIYFYYNRKGTPKLTAVEVHQRRGDLLWAFFALNILGWITWYVYPAAPPWYVEEYGLGPAQLHAKGSAAALVRFDDLVGFPVFQNFYARSEAVFGAIPSLHCGFAALTVYFAFRLGVLRVASVLYLFLMVFSAVYTHHHYVIDTIIGIFYALIASAATEWALGRFGRPLLPLHEVSRLLKGATVRRS